MDDVIVFVHSTITGNVILGNHTIVAANALVNKSYESGNVLIGGVPCKILKDNITFEEFFKNCEWMKKKQKNLNY